METIQKTGTEPEWLSWSQAKNLLKVAGVNYAWRALPDWCRRGRIVARASAAVGLDEFEPNTEIPAEFWQICSENKIRPNSVNGSITATFYDYDDRQSEGTRATLVGLSFRKSELLALVPHLSESQIESALVEDGSPEGGQREIASIEPKSLERRSGGNPGKVEVWHAFYITAMKMLNEGEMDDFKTQADLKRALLSRIDEGLSEKSIKTPVSNIWYQVLGRD